MRRAPYIYRGVLALLVLALSAFAVGADEGRIIATYGEAYKVEPSPGWQFLYNANGEIGNSANYVSLPYVAKHRVRSLVNDAGNLTYPRSNYVSFRAAEGEISRYAISAYTFPADMQGDVWLTNGNLQNRSGKGDGVSLKIYLNNVLKFTHVVAQGRVPWLFQYKLGELKKGDTVYVAVGQETKGSSLYFLHYTYELFPPDKAPDGPVNIIAPEATEAAPRRLANGRPDPGYLRKHKAHCDSALRDRPGVIFMGDSITSGWNSKILAEKFGKYKPANHGIGGEWMQGVLWRVENGVLDQVKPRAYVLMIGTNNIGHRCTADETTAGIKAIVDALQKETPDSKILLLGILPRGQSSVNNLYRERIKQTNANISKFADDDQIVYLDMGDKFLEEDGSISREVMRDFLHPTARGYMIWADAMLPTLDKMIGAAP